MLLTADEKLEHAALTRLGAATIEGERLARQVERAVALAWRRFLMDRDARHLGAALTNATASIIMAGLRQTAENAWNQQLDAVMSAVPPVGLALLKGRLDVALELDQLDLDEGVLGVDLQEGFHLGPQAVPLPEKAQQLLRPLYRTPTVSEIEAILLRPHAGLSWVDRLGRWSVEESGIRRAVASGLAQQLSTQAIAKSILPFVDQYRAAAMRIARTEIHRVNVELQMAAARESAGGREITWVYVATLDARTRPHHAARDRKRYLDGTQVPLPDGPNCRCIYRLALPNIEALIVQTGLRGLRASTSAPKGAAPAERRGQPLPNNTDYGRWFNAQPAATQRSIIGARLFDALMRSKRGVTWHRSLRGLNLLPAA